MLARRLAREIEVELESIARLPGELAGAPAGDGSYALRARGSILHDFSTGAERIFVRIAEELNGGVPNGSPWHARLPQEMALALPEVRPAVVSAGLAGELDEFRRFRHVFRNVYGFVLDPERMRELESSLASVSDRFDAEIRAFAGWMIG